MYSVFCFFCILNYIQIKFYKKSFQFVYVHPKTVSVPFLTRPSHNVNAVYFINKLFSLVPQGNFCLNS